MDKFNIKILTHEWISNEDSETDLCSHGKIEFTIGKEKILSESDGNWTISTSVLQLLKCIEPNSETETDFNPIMCCGMLLMLGCPIGLYFDLKHQNGKIVIRNIKKQYGTGDDEHVLYPKIVAKIDKSEFAINILNLAKEVKSFFNNEPKKNLDDDMDKELWFEFWNEFDELYINGIEKYNCQQLGFRCGCKPNNEPCV